MSQGPRSVRLRWAGTAGLAVAYGLLALGGMEWSRRYGTSVPVWPAAGVALAALVLGGRRLWPGVLAGYALAAALGPYPPGLAQLVAASAGVTLAAWLGAGLLERVAFHPGLESVRDFLHLMLAAAVSAVVAASLAGGAFALSAGLDAGAAAMLWMRWVLGDLNGMLIVGTLLFAWSAGRLPRSPRWWWQFAACLALAVGIGLQVFLREGERLYTFLVYIPLIWAALALRLRGATVVCLVLAGLGMLGTARGAGPFLDPDIATRVLDLQTFMLVMASSTLVLAVVADERRAHRALTLSEARLRLALEATGTGLWKLDLRSGAMTFSPECARVTGLGARDVVGTRECVVRLIHPEDLATVREAFLHALERQALFESVFRLCRPDGGEVWLEARGRAVPEGDGRPVTMLGTISDITGRKRDQRRLAEQARLLDLTADAIFIRDLAGRIDYWNRGAEALYGYTAAEACGRIARELLRSRFSRPFADVERQLHANDRWDGEIGHTCKDGSQVIVHARWVLNRGAHGRPVSVMQTHTDITARRRAEATAALLAAIDRDIAGAEGVDAMAASGLRLLGEHFGLLRCTLSDIDVEAGQVRTLHEWAEEGAPHVSGVRDAREFFTSELGRRLAAGEVVAIDDLRTHPLTAAYASNYAPYRTIALAAASYVIEGRIAGTLTVACAQPHAWRADELQVLREVVARLWPAIERERSLSALRESEARFRQMADTAPMMIWMSEPDGSCSYISRRWSEFTGRMPEDELGFGWAEAIHPPTTATKRRRAWPTGCARRRPSPSSTVRAAGTAPGAGCTPPRVRASVRGASSWAASARSWT